MSREREREKRRIFNDSDEEYRDTFMNREIVIPARGSIVMSRRECVSFLGTYKYFDKERSSGEKPLRWTVETASTPTAEEETEAQKASAETTGDTGGKMPIEKAEAILEKNAVVQ